MVSWHLNCMWFQWQSSVLALGSVKACCIYTFWNASYKSIRGEKKWNINPTSTANTTWSRHSEWHLSACPITGVSGYLPSCRQTPSLLLSGTSTATTSCACACGSRVYFSGYGRRFSPACAISVQTVAPLRWQQYKYLENTSQHRSKEWMLSNKPAEKVQWKFVTSLLTLSDLQVLANKADYIISVSEVWMWRNYC